VSLSDERAEPSPERVTEMVRSLAVAMHQSDLTELALEFGPLSLRLSRQAVSAPALSPLPPRAAAADPVPSPPEHVIAAPMIGTFYAAATPGSPPFITVGDEIVAGQTIGIIEAMKIMNEITADRSGVVAELLAANAQPVEYGTPLVRLTVGGSDRP
jgi:acetyl-CoA carboxylase biotin carboxyl carrier protein